MDIIKPDFALGLPHPEAQSGDIAVFSGQGRRFEFEAESVPGIGSDDPALGQCQTAALAAVEIDPGTGTDLA